MGAGDALHLCILNFFRTFLYMSFVIVLIPLLLYLGEFLCPKHTTRILGFCDNQIMMISTSFLSLPAYSNEVAIVTNGGSLKSFYDH